MRPPGGASLDTVLSWVLLSILHLHLVNAGEFEGCFAEPRTVNVTSERFQFRWNTNQDCAQHCGDRGFILAATRNDVCLCTMVFPERELASPVDNNASGARSPCNLACAGSLEHDQCEGDECCGGTLDDGTETYSVYAVGGLDVVTQIRRRIMRAILDNKVNWLTQGENVVRDCSNEYILLQSPGGAGEFVTLNLSHHSHRTFRRIPTVEDCKHKCNHNPDCRSITYFTGSEICTVNYKSSEQGMIVPSESPTEVYDRRCNYTAELLTNHFELEMVTFRRLLSRGLPVSQQPLYNEDFELDLTNSNAWDTVKRNIVVTNAEQYQLSTESGFQESMEEGTQESQSQSEQLYESSNTHTLKAPHLYPRPEASGFSLSTSMAANAGFAAFGIGSHISTTVAMGLTHEMSRAFTGLRARSTGGSTLSGYQQHRGKHAAKAHSSFFNNGYHKTLRTDKSQSYEFTMTVPPLHRGHIAFFVAEAPHVLKWKATFMLNGHVRLRNFGIERKVHVSRILRSKDRLFYAMGTVVYNRRTVIGKTIITDKTGKLVQSEEHLLPESKQPTVT